MSVNDVLQERNGVYGSYREGIILRSRIMALLLNRYAAHHGKPMPDHEREFFVDIVTKLVRLVITPTHLDSWQDIQGYAKLIYDSIKEDMYANQSNSSRS
jgi:hypothetical protein